MSSKKFRRIDIEKKIREYRVFYENFYFEKWMASRIIEGDISKQAKDFIMRRFWADGTVATYLINDYENNILGFAPYAPQNYDMYDYPINLHLINRRGVSEKLIPNRLMKVNKDVVIGFCNRSHKPIAYFMQKWINRIVQIEMLIDNNIGLQNIPFLLKKDGNNDSKIDDLITRILNGEIVINLDGDVIDDISLLETKIQLIADKLSDLKDRTMNEALTYLGINNNPYEKKERQIVDEVNSNNMEIEECDDAINDELDEFSNLISEVLQKELTFISKFDIIKERSEMKDGDKDEE